MKKILHVLRTVENGGTEKFLVNLLQHLDSDKFENVIVTYKNMDLPFVKDNYKYYRINEPNTGGLVKNIKELKKIMKIEKIDVVHSYTHLNSGYVMLAAFLAGIKNRITHSHRSESTGQKNFKYGIYTFVSKLLINIFANKKLACGKAAANSIFYKFSKYTIINNGINIDDYKYDDKLRKKLRKQYKINDNTIVIGIVGRLDYNKNQKFLLQVCSQLKNNDKYKILIIGDGDEKDNLIDYSKKLSIQDNLVFTGNINNVNEYYNMMDLFCLTSYNEGLPFVLIEAQTNGLKCIVSDCVDRKSNISNTITFLPLEVIEWVKVINTNSFKRSDNINKIKEKGYSIKDTVNKIEKIYLK